MLAKRMIATAVALSMSVAILASGCSIFGATGETAEIKEAADTYFSKLIKGKNTAKYVDAGSVTEPDYTDDQWDVLGVVTSKAEYEIKEIQGSKKEGKAKVKIEFKYIDAEDIEDDLKDPSLNELLDAIEAAKNTETETIKLDLVYVDEEWLVDLASDEEAKEFLKTIVDSIDLGGSKPTETEPTETTPADTEPDITSSESSESKETKESKESKESKQSSSGNGTIVNFDEMNFYINGKKYTLGKTTLQEMIDDGVPFDKNDIKHADDVVEKNHQLSSFSIELGEYLSAQVYVFNDTDGDLAAKDCYVNEIYLPIYEDRKQDILTFDFSMDLTVDDIKASCGDPDDENTYDSDDGTYHSYRMYYKTKSSKYMRGSSYTFEFINDVLRYIYIEYMP